MKLTPDVVISRYQQIRETAGYGAAQNSFKCLQSIANEMERLMKHEPVVKVIPINALAARE